MQLDSVIQSPIARDNSTFSNIWPVSRSTSAPHVLHGNQMHLEQLYRGPFKQTSERIKNLRHEYVNVSTGWTTLQNTTHSTAFFQLYFCFQKVLWDHNVTVIPHEYFHQWGCPLPHRDQGKDHDWSGSHCRASLPTLMWVLSDSRCFSLHV